MADARVLLLHGFEHHRAPEHWLWWLSEELRSRRIPVAYPQLPAPDAPLVADQCEVALAELAMLGEGERIVVTHSLGGVLWLHVAARMDPALAVDRVLMVAPPHPVRLTGAMGDFTVAGLDPASALSRGARTTTVVARSEDPYRPESIASLTAGWPVRTVELPGIGHLNPDDGHGPWAFALDWVLGGGRA